MAEVRCRRGLRHQSHEAIFCDRLLNSGNTIMPDKLDSLIKVTKTIFYMKNFEARRSGSAEIWLYPVDLIVFLRYDIEQTFCICKLGGRCEY